ncbi:HipA domain-containing protein [Psychromicrobium xiongbiense]|uniref:HipA domain-containing protein n=1 Tax=Psychromicrobium xiongbiense TaxID=3051184 RepID=UPI0025569D01|nr:HipA domain-containing protein [Psychromicrobium sp. YIM S02556]
MLTPGSPEDPTGIYDEEYGARIARAVGLSSFSTWIEEFDGVPAVVIERYDRSSEAPEGRIHQEDFNQALGAVGNEKYQRISGKVSTERIAGMLHEVSDRESTARMFRLVVLSAAPGNLDLHAKNLSLLHPLEGAPSLAPAYDVVPQAHRPNDGELAMSVGGEYRHADITLEHLVAEGRACRVENAARITIETLGQTLEAVRHEVPHEHAYPGVQSDIERFTTNLLAGRAIGD